MTLRAALLRSTCCTLGLLLPFGLTGCGSLGGFVAAPVKVQGHLEAEAFSEGSSEEERRSGERTELFLDAESFIWQPWFITVDGDIAVTQEIQTGDSDTSNTFWSGGAGMNVLPISNYPSAFAYRHSDSRSSGSINARDRVSDSVTVRARQVLGAGLRTGFHATYETIDEFEFGEEERLSASFDGAKTFDSSTLTLALDYEDQDLQSDLEEDESEEFLAGTLNFNTKPFQDAYSDSTLTFIDETEVEGEETEETLLTQGVTTLNWQPLGQPYRVNAALRVLQEENQTEDTDPTIPSRDTDNLIASGLAGLSYIFSPRFVGNAGVSASYEETQRRTDDPLAGFVEETTDEDITGSIFGGASYRSESIDIRGFDWHWFSTGDVRLTVENEDGFEDSEAVTVGQNFDRVFADYIAAPLRMSISQSATLRHSTEEGFVPVLDHRVSFTHNSASGGVPIYARLSASDRRELAGDDKREFQLIDFQLNRQERLDATSTWTAGFGTQLAREDSEDDGESLSLSANGSLGYFATNLFDVQRLSFSSQLDVAALGLEDAFEDDNNENRDEDELRSEWRNILQYRIGRVVMSLEGTVAYEDEEFRDLVIFRIRREFDTVF
jgi:hypothetical protein